ncbi:hypothetical protein HKK55_19565 [Pseudomonas sp. ADAK18]|nr:hypothetical protein HKK55_19565 [Pseudomonas sp. ADAK18]
MSIGFQAGQLRCGLECRFLAGGDLVFQLGASDKVRRQKVVIQVLLIAGADIQFTTQCLELVDGHRVV